MADLRDEKINKSLITKNRRKHVTKTNQESFKNVFTWKPITREHRQKCEYFPPDGLLLISVKISKYKQIKPSEV